MSTIGMNVSVSAMSNLSDAQCEQSALLLHSPFFIGVMCLSLTVWLASAAINTFLVVLLHRIVLFDSAVKMLFMNCSLCLVINAMLNAMRRSRVLWYTVVGLGNQPCKLSFGYSTLALQMTAFECNPRALPANIFAATALLTFGALAIERLLTTFDVINKRNATEAQKKRRALMLLVGTHVVALLTQTGNLLNTAHVTKYNPKRYEVTCSYFAVSQPPSKGIMLLILFINEFMSLGVFMKLLSMNRRLQSVFSDRRVQQSLSERVHYKRTVDITNALFVTNLWHVLLWLAWGVLSMVALPSESSTEANKAHLTSVSQLLAILMGAHGFLHPILCIRSSESLRNGFKQMVCPSNNQKSSSVASDVVVPQPGSQGRLFTKMQAPTDQTVQLSDAGARYFAELRQMFKTEYQT